MLERVGKTSDHLHILHVSLKLHYFFKSHVQNKLIFRLPLRSFLLTELFPFVLLLIVFDDYIYFELAVLKLIGTTKIYFKILTITKKLHFNKSASQVFFGLSKRLRLYNKH